MSSHKYEWPRMPDEWHAMSDDEKYARMLAAGDAFCSMANVVEDLIEHYKRLAYSKADVDVSRIMRDNGLVIWELPRK